MNEKKEIIIKTANDLDDTPIEWLIPSWIPKRGITLLCSDGGTGKSFLWVSLASALSKGNRTLLHNRAIEENEKKILCFSGEDAESILKKRLKDANANLNNIYVFAQDTKATGDITFDSMILKEIIVRTEPQLLIFDPLQSFIGSNVDMSRRNQMRQAMKPLLSISAEYNLPVLVVVHTNKRKEVDSGRDKMADSADLWDIARSVIMIGFAENKNRYISLEKSSYADHMNVETVLFNLEEGRVNYQGRINKKMRDFVKDKKDGTAYNARTVSKKSECEDLILESLPLNEWMDNQKLEEILRNNDFSTKTIRTAKTNLKNEKLIEMQKSSDGKTYYRATDDIA